MNKIKNTPTVLMYHGIIAHPASVPTDREVGAELYDLAVDKFQEQMSFLNENGFSVGRVGGENLGQPNVVITFDDGEENNIQYALPILSRYKFSAYFFVTVNRIGKKGYMNWEQLKELRDANMVIGSHSFNHVILTELKNVQIERELSDSKYVMERELKINIDDFSVPRGFCNEKILRMAQEAGYKRIFLSETLPYASDALILRTAVKSDWSLKRFEQALHGKVPLDEVGFNALKTAAKKVLGNGGYNTLRKGLLGHPSRQR